MHPADNHDNATDELANDADSARALLAGEYSQFNRRMYIRALFAYFEGFAFFLRRNAEELLSTRMALGKPISLDTLFLLKEKVPHITKGGKIRPRDHKVPFADQFAFTLRTFSDALEIEKDPFKEHGWDHFQKTLAVRDRITHPRLKSDVEISDDDLAICESGLSWFKNLVVELSKKDGWGLKRN